MGRTRKSWRGALMAFLVVSLLFSSGCALFLLGAAGTGGYMIRKGEDTEKEESSELQSSAKSTVASLAEGQAGQKMLLPGGSR